VGEGSGAAQTALVVGTGLIGTSAALALSHRGWQVWLDDDRRPAVDLAVQLGAGQPWEGGVTVDHALLAVPPAAVASTLLRLQRLGLECIFSDTASVKTHALAEVEALGCDMSRYVPGHPIAGRERGGAGQAQADLFVDRVWAVCPTSRTGVNAVAAVENLVRACGARPVHLDAADHDRVMAALSHLPQLVASALASVVVELGPDELALAGSGFRDTTRLAAADPQLWTDILTANGTEVSGALAQLRSRLDAVLDQGGGLRPAELRQLLEEGNLGRDRLPDKSGRVSRDWARISVVILDKPGELARLLVAAGEAGVNVEDLRVEHSPEQPVGLIELAIAPAAREVLLATLQAQGWPAHLDL
jgi:prephenate dehydrogenase